MKNKKRYPRALVCSNSSCAREGKPVKVGRYLGGEPYQCSNCRSNRETIDKLIKEQKAEQKKDEERSADVPKL